MMPIRDTLDIVSGKWKLLIIFHLRHGARRFKELQRELTGITPRMLSKELKDLEQNDLIMREVFDTTPVTVAYSLTEHGDSLCPVIQSLYEWGQKHRRRILKVEEVEGVRRGTNAVV
jgi:DNA-binding HxlR family transcriptional regulator